VDDELEKQHGYEIAERAAIYEYEAGMTREEAEKKAIACIDLHQDES
jgi:hypothetical protein